MAPGVSQYVRLRSQSIKHRPYTRSLAESVFVNLDLDAIADAMLRAAGRPFLPRPPTPVPFCNILQPFTTLVTKALQKRAPAPAKEARSVSSTPKKRNFNGLTPNSKPIASHCHQPNLHHAAAPPCPVVPQHLPQVQQRQLLLYTNPYHHRPSPATYTSSSERRHQIMIFPLLSTKPPSLTPLKRF